MAWPGPHPVRAEAQPCCPLWSRWWPAGSGQCLLRGGVTVSGRKARPEVREVTAMELAGAQVNADEQSSGERRGTSERASLRFQTKGSPIMEDAQPRRPPGAQEPICPAVPSPIPALGSAPPSSPGGGGTRWHRLLRGGDQSPHSSLWKEMPSSGKGGRGYSVGGGRSPTPRCQPTHLRAAQHPHPSP